MEIPPEFDEAFLDWFRELTERTWAEQPTPTLEGFQAARCGGTGFQQGTRWSGLSEAEIEAIERRLSLRFPPDYRLFLRRLHSTDRPMVSVGFVDGNRMVLTPSWSITNWRIEENPIQKGLGWIADGFAFDVEMNGLWKPVWGARPEPEAARRQRVAEVLAAAPRLIPVHGHRYLVAEPCRAGNPVLSIHQSDICPYGVDLRAHLIADFARWPDADFESGYEAALGIQFWGEFVS